MSPIQFVFIQVWDAIVFFKEKFGLNVPRTMIKQMMFLMKGFISFGDSYILTLIPLKFFARDKNVYKIVVMHRI